MRHAEVRVSAKEDTSLDHGRRKEMSRRREKESASKEAVQHLEQHAQRQVIAPSATG
jgi:hypothetical protein